LRTGVAGRVMLALVVITTGLTTLAPVVAADPPPSGSATFSFTGAAQSWTVPAGVSSIAVDLYGAQGGGGVFGGPGGRVRAILAVSPGDVFQVNVGGAGGWNGAGFNGGGAATNSTFGGGGGTDLRKNGTALANRVVVAGGGGGASSDVTWASPTQGVGGAGGGLAGGAGLAGPCASAGEGGIEVPRV
jgi:hypothetical protein